MIHTANVIVAETVRIAQMIIILALLVVGYYAMDRDPPFAVVSVTPTSGRPGEYVTLQAVVRRDVHRRCSAEFSRYLYDSSGWRYDLGHSMASSDMIQRLESTSPNTLKISVMLPQTMAPGAANLQTVLSYQCNRTHKLWPIEVTTDLPFMVSP